MVFTGFAWFTALLVDATPPWLNTIGLAVQSVWIVGLVYLLLAFPSGRLPGRLDRWLVGGGLVAGVGLQLLAMLYGNKAGLRCPDCTNNLLQVVRDNHKAEGWLGLQRLIGAVLIVTVIAMLIRRWLSASAAQRRAVWPVLVAGCATLAALGWTVVFDLLGDPLGALPANVYFALMATVPVAVLFVSSIRTRTYRTCWTAQSSAKNGPPGKDLSSCCRGAQVTPDLATSCLGHPFPAESFVSMPRVVEVRLDRRRRTTETVGDLSVRHALVLTVVPSQRDGASPFPHSLEFRL